MNISSIRMPVRSILFSLCITFASQGFLFAGATLSISSGGEQPRQTVQAQIVPASALVARAFESVDWYEGMGAGQAVLDPHAATELQLAWLVSKLDRTQTHLGSYGLVKSMYPTNDFAQIERKQLLIKTLLNDAHLFNGLTQGLQNIAKAEEAVLAYWNEKDALSLHAGRLYFNLIPSLNRSPFALHAVTLFDAAANLKSILGTLFLQGLFNEMERYGKYGPREGWFDRACAGSYKLVTDHNFLTTKYMHESLDGANDDTYATRGNNVYTDGTFLDNVLYKEAVFNKQNGYVDGIFERIFGRKILNNNLSSGINKTSAWLEQIARTAIWDYLLYKSIIAAKDGLKDAHRNIEGLRARMVSVAQFIQAVEQVGKLINAHAELQHVLPAKVQNDLLLSAHASSKLNELIELLNTATFKDGSSLIYNRGRVLYANLLFAEVKYELIPVMHAIAQVDSYCSIARLMKEFSRGANRFSFATFTETPQAYLELDNCWISVLGPKEAVANSMILGRTNPGKVIITGPNGGGKSTWLKAAGQAVAMAQAWGIVPARKAHMTIFDAVRTSLEPRENLACGISKFMAQKESMDRIQQFVLEERAKVSLILLDEPYDGTVTDEIARRTGEFCNSIIDSANCLAIIATHVMPTLENEALYGWYHVDITEPKRGAFRRTFKLRSGLAKRWFNDKAWRGRFIDWLTIEIRRKALDEARAQAAQKIAE